MILKLDKPKLLGDAISIISEIVTEVRIKLLKEGMSIIAVDPANVALIIFKLPKESFTRRSISKGYSAFYSSINGVDEIAELSKILLKENRSNAYKYSWIDGNETLERLCEYGQQYKKDSMHLRVEPLALALLPSR